ncbi:MAG: transcriptional repressor [Paramuribaculum sp.]|nr:transcriptional repressor [Paramuribaculum sp.]
MIDERHKASAVTAFATYMKRHRMRKTPERFAIFERILSMRDHFTVDDLYAAMEKTDYHVSRATIYNTVNILVDAGLLVRHTFAGRQTQYERISGPGRHHHLISSQCGRIKEIVDSDIDSLLAHKSFGSFTPLFAEVSIYGLCRSCMKKSKRAERASAIPRRQERIKDPSSR